MTFAHQIGKTPRNEPVGRGGFAFAFHEFESLLQAHPCFEQFAEFFGENLRLRAAHLDRSSRYRRLPCLGFGSIGGLYLTIGGGSFVDLERLQAFAREQAHRRGFVSSFDSSCEFLSGGVDGLVGKLRHEARQCLRLEPWAKAKC
jgi:hypothetical protein